MLVSLMLIYVVSPIDIVPEVVLGFGFIDDALIAIYVISSISNELDKYISNKEDDDIGESMGKTIENVEYEIRDEDFKKD